MEGAPQVHSLREGGVCATGPYRTPSILGHTTETRESKELYIIHRNKHREAAKMRRQRKVAQRKKQIKNPQRELNRMETSNLSDA